ncbi:hypothetical protein [Shimia aestuarii]|uniref:Sulfotransferase family protein n=1 Tax=Shimia aestuarii TaxID=254406 RepID=A0A1I4TJ85_9RHOB|nr:hypothetical protein [Shimia aestuarii]SFM76693.1 hypothetical protein SAMN04488042_11717 [Shimia aestuarii]
MKLKRKLFLHIGCHRTATTSIQSFLRENHGLLIKLGILVPFARGRHLDWINKIFNGTLDVDDFCGDLTKRANNKPNTIRAIVLSDEDISMRRDLEVLARLQKHFDVEVIYSLRRQDLWLESWYFQNIKFQWMPKYAHASFNDFIRMREDFHWVHYDQYLQMVESHFGIEAIKLSVFEKSQMPGGPITAFAKMIGINDISAFPHLPYVNASFSAPVAEIVRHLPLDQLPPQKRQKVIAKLFAIDMAMRGDIKTSEWLLPFDERQEILSHYTEGNTNVALKYFGREILFNDPLPDPNTALGSLELPKESSKILEDFVAPLILQFAEDL